MDISKTNQKQEAGDNSTQIQQIGDNSSQTIIENLTNTITVTNEVSVSDIVSFTTTLSTQVTQQALALCTQISKDICINRMEAFESRWTPVITKMEGVVNHLVDPKFQFMLRDANISAAKSSREQDFDMLTQLLVCHVEKGKDMKIDAGINRAIQIVNEVDNDALCGLTCVTSLLNTMPSFGGIYEGLKAIDLLYSKLLYTELPDGTDWIDHLHILGALNIQTGHFHKLEKILWEALDGYVCVGIKEGSREHEDALGLLKEKGYYPSVFTKNECLEGYLRLPIVRKNQLNLELRPILDYYSKDKSLFEQVKSNFLKIWDSFGNLKTVREWFNSIPLYFRISSIGMALAQTNAKRCRSDYPDLI